MSYTRINGMRSARYPLQGGDCGCGGPCCGGMGEAPEPKTVGLGTALLIWGGLFAALSMMRSKG